MNQNYIILVIIFFVGFSCLPLLFCSLISIRQRGVGLWLFSPLPTFIFAYIMAFGFVPFMQEAFSVRIYTEFDVSENSLQLAEILGCLSCWAFSAGFLLYNKPFSAKETGPSDLPISTLSMQKARIYQKVTFGVSIVLQILFVLFLFSSHALSMNFAQNRQAFLASMLGAGYITLINQLALDVLMLGLLLFLWTRRIGPLGVFSLALFIIPNFMITNRGMITSLFYLIVFTYFLTNLHKAKKIKPARLFIMLAVIVSLGALIGLSRNLGTDVAEDTPSTSTEAILQSFPPVVRGVVFLSYTFDMGILFQKTISREEDIEWGRSWLEDIFYTFLPRAIFPDKPVVFGATRLQEKVAPEIYGGNVDVSGTFPIGIFGESYINFGIPGIISVLFLLGITLKYWYTQCLQLTKDRDVNWKSLSFMVLYAALCSNSLPYIRGFGGFLAIVAFTAVLLICSIILIRLISQVILNRQQTGAAVSAGA